MLNLHLIKYKLLNMCRNKQEFRSTKMLVNKIIIKLKIVNLDARIRILIPMLLIAMLAIISAQLAQLKTQIA